MPDFIKISSDASAFLKEVAANAAFSESSAQGASTAIEAAFAKNEYADAAAGLIGYAGIANWDAFGVAKLSDLASHFGRNDLVIEINDALVKADGADYWAQFRLAEGYTRSGQLEKAAEGFKRCLEINENAPFAQERMAYIAYRQGQPDRAIEMLEYNAARFPDHVWTLDRLLQIRIARGEYGQARADVERVWGKLDASAQGIISSRMGELERNQAFEEKIRANLATIAPLFKGCTLVDVGAADGFQWFFSILSRLGLVSAIGFEPDDAECAALNGTFPKAKFLPFAIGASDGPATFNITDVMSCSSLLEPDQEVLKRFPVRSCFQPKREVPVDVRSLASLQKEGHLPAKIDFLKVDVQGAESLILEGLGSGLSSVLAMELETQIIPIYKGQKTLFEIAQYLEPYGFRLRGIEPQGTFEGEVVEVEAYFAKDLALLSDQEKQRLFAWEAITGCPQLPFFGDNQDLKSYPRLARTLGEADTKNARLRREIRALFE